jgi:hypothetical protein
MTHNQLRSPLRVLDGGFIADRLQDDTADRQARDRLREEIAEAARLCDRLEENGLRIAFELGGPERVRVSITGDNGDAVRELDPHAVTDIARLVELSGVGA